MVEPQLKQRPPFTPEDINRAIASERLREQPLPREDPEDREREQGLHIVDLLRLATQLLFEWYKTPKSFRERRRQLIRMYEDTMERVDALKERF